VLRVPLRDHARRRGRYRLQRVRRDRPYGASHSVAADTRAYGIDTPRGYSGVPALWRCEPVSRLLGDAGLYVQGMWRICRLNRKQTRTFRTLPGETVYPPDSIPNLRETQRATASSTARSLASLRSISFRFSTSLTRNRNSLIRVVPFSAFCSARSAAVRLPPSVSFVLAIAANVKHKSRSVEGSSCGSDPSSRATPMCQAFHSCANVRTRKVCVGSTKVERALRG
jgi:hypothetical protein